MDKSEHDFHITLGFNPRDVHVAAGGKGVGSLVYDLDPIEIRNLATHGLCSYLHRFTLKHPLS